MSYFRRQQERLRAAEIKAGHSPGLQDQRLIALPESEVWLQLRPGVSELVLLEEEIDDILIDEDDILSLACAGVTGATELLQAFAELKAQGIEEPDYCTLAPGAIVWIPQPRGSELRTA